MHTLRELLYFVVVLERSVLPMSFRVTSLLPWGNHKIVSVQPEGYVSIYSGNVVSHWLGAYTEWSLYYCVNSPITTTKQNTTKTLYTFYVLKTKNCHDANHDDVIKWKHFPRYWPFVRGIHRSPVNSPHKGQWRGALVFYLIHAWTNGWVKQSRRLWFETPSRSLWCHCNDIVTIGIATTSGDDKVGIMTFRDIQRPKLWVVSTLSWFCQ